MNRVRSLRSLRLVGQRALIRVDFNVPLDRGKVVDDFRIRAAIPTITYCFSEGACVVLMSHLGRPKGGRVEGLSLIPVGEVLSDMLEKPIKFSESCVSEESIAVSQNLAPGEIHLLNNLRFHPGETENEPQFSKNLARHGTVYVNDAFGTAHRAHASNVGVASHFTERAMGFLMEREYDYLHNVLQEPKRPLVLILGGAKISTKLLLVHRFLREADDIIVGGGMAFTFLRASGHEVGKSLVEEGLIGDAKRILAKAKEHSVSIHLPLDCLVTEEPESGRTTGTRSVDSIRAGETGVDIGEETTATFCRIVGRGRTVVWNGPMGVFEKAAFRRGTISICNAVSKITERGGVSIIGGGDTAAAVRQFGFANSVSHISTGGGASLELLAGKELPAFAALR